MDIENRIGWVDVAKGIGILLVVIGHAFLLKWTTPLYAFHLPLFFFLTGLVTNFSKEPIEKFIQKKGNGVIRPYLLMLIFGILLCWMVPQWRGGLTLKSLLQSFYLGVPHAVQNTSLWYLPCLFFALLISRGVDSVLGHWRWRGLMLLIYAVTLPYFLAPLVKMMVLPGGRMPMKIDVAFIAIVFMLAASWWRQRVIVVIEALANPLMILTMLFATWSCATQNGWINMCDLAFGNGKILFFPIAFCGLLMICALAVFISQWPNSWLARGLRYYGRNCLLVFIFQGVFLRLYFWVFNRCYDLKMGYLANNPIQHQIGGFVVTFFVMSPIMIAIFNMFRRRIHASK